VHETPADELAAVLERLHTGGREVLAVDLTPAALRPHGFRVVRALVPDLVPLSPPGHLAYLGSPRLFEVPRRLGDPAPPRDAMDLNPDPHPFP
jgi:ribosomal protein S12 methylthiotransferase accessory factor